MFINSCPTCWADFPISAKKALATGTNNNTSAHNITTIKIVGSPPVRLNN